MTKFTHSDKPLVVNPLRVGQRTGAALAFLGLGRCMPVEHGVRGCTAFTKLFLMRHFREPIPMQTTAMDQVATILGADENIIEALTTVIERDHPAIIGLFANTLSECQGVDIALTLAEFRRRHPEHDHVAVVPVTDFPDSGCLETGYACAVHAIMDTLMPARTNGTIAGNHVNVRVPATLTPGDVEQLKGWVTSFGLVPVVLPDLADSLDGHMAREGFLPLTYGGISRNEIERMNGALATLVVGTSLHKAADLLRDRTGIPDFRFPHLMGLEACDAFTARLRELTRRTVPAHLLRQRAQLLDAMVDCQFFTAGTTAAVAADPDHLVALASFLTSNGIRVPTAVTTHGPAFAPSAVGRIVVGDLDDFERESKAHSVQLLLANSHAAGIAKRLRLPLLRVGFPQHDYIGCHAKSWIGYPGSRQTLFDVANLLLTSREELPPYQSIYRDTESLSADAPSYRTSEGAIP
jgi:nitrogenase molybdenum-iron protein NifN